ncbi:MAG TPA: diguanylate cyclase [Acidimicrobiales bacterium]|nr:diguanylate cyclase [Acidimicrobiales bacterium]
MATPRVVDHELAQLWERVDTAVTDQQREACLELIDEALERSTSPLARAELLMCRTRLRANQWHTREVLDDAVAAMELFEQAHEPGLALEAASLGAAFASRLGELSLAAELATKSIVGVRTLDDDELRAEVENRLAIFCYSFLDYERSVQQLELALAAAGRIGDRWKMLRELHNIADALLIAVRMERACGTGDGRIGPDGVDRVRRAQQVVDTIVASGTPDTNRRMGVQRLQAELLVEDGRPAEALELLRSTAGDASHIVWAAGQAALALVEARCLRALGRPQEAVVAARRARDLAEPSDDRHETMLILDELVAAEAQAGDLAAALEDSLELKRQVLDVHRAQTAQLVEQVWARASLERERRSLEVQKAAAIRSAEEDALTRIGNRRLLERCLAEVQQESEHVALLMADIDNFKDINDTFGHEVGDHVLRAIGQMLAADARTGQVVVRYGGEEFVFALPGVEVPAARDFAERIRTKVSSYPWEELESRLAVTISIGVAHGRSRNWRSVLAAADRALYMAKAHGRDRVEIAAKASRRTA